MTANVVYEVYKALSPEEKGSFIAMLQHEEILKQKIITKKENKKSKAPISNQEARDYLLKNVFSKSLR